MEAPSFERQRREIARVQEKYLHTSVDGRRIQRLRQQGSQACDISDNGDNREVSDGRR